ncbi:uncharacterized protein [Dermacentor andersoni]|uniref:uncharacterized protein n=1 Tax=Dermacentor andersoni TaxID=34620 RepID=UPI003B3A000E
MIPKRTVLLPCSHALCQSCHAASLMVGVGQCPLGQVQFEEAECIGYEFPTKIANTLKVYCWNEEHGCEYTGTMDRMLKHYEAECTFHTVECLRCGEGVQHRDLPTHYMAGCSAGVSSAITECPSSERTALTLEDVNATLEDLKAMLQCLNYDRLLPVIQSQLNELTEQVRSQETRFAGINRVIGASERNLKAAMDQITATISATVSPQPTSLQIPEEEASTSTSLSLHWGHDMILRKLERLVDVQHSRKTSPKPASILEVDCRHLCSALSTTAARTKEFGLVQYDLILKNCREINQYQGRRKKFADIIVWHMRDTYFMVTVFKCCGSCASTLTVEIEFNGLLVDSRCWPPFCYVVVHENSKKFHWLTPRAIPCLCSRYDDSLQHSHLEFHIEIASLNIDNLLQNGETVFSIMLSVNEEENGINGEP